MNQRLSLKRKDAARLAAAQACYRLRVEDITLGADMLAEQTIALWRASKENDDNSLPFEAMPEVALLKKILLAREAHLPNIHAALETIILPEWKKERMSAVMFGLMEAACGEFFAYPDKARAVMIQAHGDVAANLLGEEEHRYFHKALNVLFDGLAQHRN